MSVTISSFNAIHSVIKKMCRKGQVAANGMAYFIFGYFSTKLGTCTSEDGHEKIIT
jgi:hypothetical protein